MSKNDPSAIGSPYNPQNQPSQQELPAPLAETPDRTLPERLEARAAERFDLPTECFDFPSVVIPRRTDDGLFVFDNRNLIKYNIETGEFKPTGKLGEMFEVEDHNQHAAATVERMILS